jgi:hypothetical protein
VAGLFSKEGELMKRLLLASLALLALLAIAVPAAAAPAPKTTGDIGYTAVGVQRHFTFNAIQSPANTVSGVLWDISTVTQFNFTLTTPPGDPNVYTHDAFLTQTPSGVTGDGGYPSGGPYQYHWNITSGSVVGATIDLTMDYDVGAPGTTMHMTGTIAADGTITGTWADNFGGARTGTWTASGATFVASYNAKGLAVYTDENGLFYVVAVKAVSVAAPNAWFAGPVIWANFDPGIPDAWLFVKVQVGSRRSSRRGTCRCTDAG